MNNVDVVYTPWQNLKKTASMDVGQVGFHNSKMVSFPRLGTFMTIMEIDDRSFLILMICSGPHCEGGEAYK